MSIGSSESLIIPKHLRRDSQFMYGSKPCKNGHTRSYNQCKYYLARRTASIAQTFPDFRTTGTKSRTPFDMNK